MLNEDNALPTEVNCQATELAPATSTNVSHHNVLEDQLNEIQLSTQAGVNASFEPIEPVISDQQNRETKPVLDEVVLSDENQKQKTSQLREKDSVNSNYDDRHADERRNENLEEEIDPNYLLSIMHLHFPGQCYIVRRSSKEFINLFALFVLIQF